MNDKHSDLDEVTHQNRLRENENRLSEKDNSIFRSKEKYNTTQKETKG